MAPHAHSATARQAPSLSRPQPARQGDADAGQDDPRRDDVHAVMPNERHPRQRAIERERERHRLDDEQPHDDRVTRQPARGRLGPSLVQVSNW